MNTIINYCQLLYQIQQMDPRINPVPPAEETSKPPIQIVQYRLSRIELLLSVFKVIDEAGLFDSDNWPRQYLLEIRKLLDKQKDEILGKGK